MNRGIYKSYMICTSRSGVMNAIIFWDITSCSPLKVNRLFGGTFRLHFQGRISLLTAFILVSCSVYYTLKMEAICSSELSVGFQRTTLLYIPEDSFLDETQGYCRPYLYFKNWKWSVLPGTIIWGCWRGPTWRAVAVGWQRCSTYLRSKHEISNTLGNVIWRYWTMTAVQPSIKNVNHFCSL
jgi:hypothetical protein